MKISELFKYIYSFTLILVSVFPRFHFIFLDLVTHVRYWELDTEHIPIIYIVYHLSKTRTECQRDLSVSLFNST